METAPARRFGILFRARRRANATVERRGCWDIIASSIHSDAFRRQHNAPTMAPGRARGCHADRRRSVHAPKMRRQAVLEKRKKTQEVGKIPALAERFRRRKRLQLGSN
jgi:hypothetical protein